MRIAANPSFGAVVLPRAAAAFRERHAGTRLDIMTTGHPAVVDRVALRQADLGLTQFGSSHPGLTSRKLGSYACQVALPPGSALAALDVVPAAALARHPMILYEPDTPIGDAVQRYAAANGVELRPDITVRYPMIACMFVDAGLGAAVIDPFVVIDSGTRWRFALRPLAPPLHIDTWLLTRAARPLPHPGRMFIRVLSGLLQTLAGGRADVS